MNRSGSNTILNKTVKYGYCIGCGVCEATCPHNAISMELNPYKEWNPVINNKCINCGNCVQVCPHTKPKLLDEAKKVESVEDKYTYGIEEADYYLAWDTNKRNREKSASGGVVTVLASYLLKEKIIDAVIHGEMRQGKIGEIHYRASMSTTQKELDEKRSSFYFPLCFTDILTKLKNSTKTYLIIGTPCIIRGVTNVLKRNKDYKKIKFYTVALVCSHNVNGQFIDFLAESLGISRKESFKVNLRYKDKEIKDANNFYSCFFNERGIIKKENRFKSLFTKTWRDYYFAMNVCNYCSDFWGYTADMSVKDAWGKWSCEDKLGKNIIVVRNKRILNYLNNIESLKKQKLSFEEVKNCQLSTTIFKQVNALNKNSKSFFSKINRNNGLCSNAFHLKISKFMYKNFGYYGLRSFILVENFLNFLKKRVKVQI